MIATGSAPYVNGWGKLQVKLALEIFFAPLPFTGFAPLVPVLLLVNGAGLVSQAAGHNLSL